MCAYAELTAALALASNEAVADRAAAVEAMNNARMAGERYVGCPGFTTAYDAYNAASDAFLKAHARVMAEAEQARATQARDEQARATHARRQGRVVEPV